MLSFVKEVFLLNTQRDQARSPDDTKKKEIIDINKIAKGGYNNRHTEELAEVLLIHAVNLILKDIKKRYEVRDTRYDNTPGHFVPRPSYFVPPTSYLSPAICQKPPAESEN
jgi:hypothetical protein